MTVVAVAFLAFAIGVAIAVYFDQRRVVTLCPWCGKACNCAAFPFRVDGQIPQACKEKKR